MAYADDGAGASIILVHGWAAHGGFFDDLRARLSRTHRVLTPTLRGHPGTGHGGAPLTIETLADDIAHFAEALDLKAVVAVGWSMGAMALWAAAPKLGARLAGIVAEDMAPRMINDASWPYGIVGGYGADDVPATLKEIGGDWPAYVARFAPRMFAADAEPKLVSWVVGEMSKANPEAMAPYWASMAQQDFRAAIARIEQPMLVIHGADSPIYPDEATQFIADVAPNAKRVVIAGAGHVPHLEAPDAFFQQIESFVRTTRAPDLRSGGAVP
jgi:pimeloyl-ACP methyl ester carboxylesterase